MARHVFVLVEKRKEELVLMSCVTGMGNVPHLLNLHEKMIFH